MRRVGSGVRLAHLLASVSLVAVLSWAQPADAAVPLPSRVAAIGDSITRAYDSCCSYGDHPAQSWSTGSAWWDGIGSHYERIVARNPAATRFNNAVSGAKMDAAPGQATAAVSQGADYVTVLLGANDVCTSSPATMTSVDSFASSYRAALDILARGLPNARIFVASIPNVYQLWEVLHTSWTARAVWSAAGICQSMLSSTNTEAQRQEVLAREAQFNQILAEGCAQYAMCRWDGGAVFGFEFSASRVSSLDYFHPNLSGQATLASITWRTSWWGDI